MNPYSKNTSNPHISHHSFENSLQQIHQTNDLLSNIENKISDFMGKDSKSTAVFKERSPIGPSGLNSSRSRTSYHPAREENSPLKTRNSTYQDFAQYLSPPNDVKSPPNPVNYASNSQSQGNIQPFTAGDYASVGSVARESIDMYNYNSNPISRNTINRKEYPMERETSGRALIDKMNRIEESYEAKIKLLEERLRQSESEAYSLKEMNQTLEHQIGQLRTETFQWQDRFKKDYANSEEERGVVRTLKKEMETLDRKYRSVLEDKDRLKRQYNELMRVHNQMIELDMQRNEKSLMESRRAEQNEEHNNEEVQGLVESINAYKQEVDFLKENNNLMQVQLKYEVEKLQDDLNRQIEENQRLRNGIREDKLIALGSRSPSAIGTTHKKSIRDITERSGQRMTTGNYEEEDIKALGREELVRYAKGLKDMFLNLEEQHHEQVRYNENLQTELESLRRDNTDRFIRNASPNGLESNRRMNTSYLRTSTRKSPKKEFYSEDRTKRGYDASVERRKRLLNLQRDLDNVDPGERFLKTNEVIPRKSRSRSRSVKFSPGRGGKGERISFGQPKESVETARSNGEFERELTKLKQMIGEKVPLKRIKERPTKKDGETSGRVDRSDLKGKVKPKTKVVKEKEKKKKL